MSKRVVETVIGKALLDIEFRKTLLTNPNAALAGLDLSPDEEDSLRALDAETLDSMVGIVDRRTSKRVTRF